MRKILLIGPGGAGKSTLARRLGEISGLPVVHLDAIYWQSGWREPSKDAWQRTVAQLVDTDAWIMDGNYGGTMNLRMAACDTVVLLNPSPAVCIWRILTRWVRFRGRSRPEMAKDCPEHLSWTFLWWILTYRKRRLPAVLSRLATAAAQGKTTVVLRTDREVDEFCRHVPYAAQQTHAVHRDA
jgi:adenylate kinase family enzyme